MIVKLPLTLIVNCKSMLKRTVRVKELSASSERFATLRMIRLRIAKAVSLLRAKQCFALHNLLAVRPVSSAACWQCDLLAVRREPPGA